MTTAYSLLSAFNKYTGHCATNITCIILSALTWGKTLSLLFKRRKCGGEIINNLPRSHI